MCYEFAMKYAITVSDDKGPDCAVPTEPEMPATDPESCIEGWDLVSSVWQQTWIERSRLTATYACIGRFVWTWKAIYKGASK